MAVMSVINKMLRELNQGPGSQMKKGTAPLFTQAPVPRRSSWQLAITLLILFVVCLSAWWNFYGESAHHIQQKEFERLVEKLEYLSEQEAARQVTSVITEPVKVIHTASLTPLPQPVTHETYLDLPLSPAVTQKNTPKVQLNKALELPLEETQTEEIEDVEEVEEAAAQTVRAEEALTQEKKQSLVIERVTLSAAEEISLLKEQLALAAQDPEQQITLLQRMLDIDPHLHAQRQQLAGVLKKSARYDEAKTLLVQGMGLYPDVIELRLDLAVLLLFLGELQSAFDYLYQVKAGSHDFPVRFYALRALAAMKVNALDDAVLMYEHLVQKEPEKARWWLGLATAREQQRDVASALSAYRHAQRLGITHQRTQEVVEQRILALEATP